LLNELSAPCLPRTSTPAFHAGGAGDPGRMGAKGLIHHNETSYFGLRQEQMPGACTWPTALSPAAPRCHPMRRQPGQGQQVSSRRLGALDPDLLAPVEFLRWAHVGNPVFLLSLCLNPGTATCIISPSFQFQPIPYLSLHPGPSGTLPP
jgi:hypothetical protein